MKMHRLLSAVFEMPRFVPPAAFFTYTGARRLSLMLAGPNHI